ncbi:MAG: sensor histidine kinase [Collinsella sp.]|nr:sensor histidine kinase [Collinsella sp.]
MTYRSYLRASLPMLAILFAVDALCALMLVVADVHTDLVILVCVAMALASVGALSVDYLRKRSFLKDLQRCVDQLEHPLWLPELIDRPDGYLEGELAYDALRAVARAANDDVSSYRRQMGEYREYIETWVHEAKSPLAAAHLMLENMSDELSGAQRAADPASILERLETLDDELDRMEGYVEQALFFARSETLDRDYLIREHSLRDLVLSALRSNSRALISGRVSPVFSDLDRHVFTDEKWMVFILGQIIQNSVKYARSEGAVIRFSSRLVDEGLSSEAVELAVGDNGRGVSAADLARVFERGFTGAAGREGKRSTGMGLYLVERLCVKMGIGIGADSVEGEGFTVFITFPTNRFHYFE